MGKDENVMASRAPWRLSCHPWLATVVGNCLLHQEEDARAEVERAQGTLRGALDGKHGGLWQERLGERVPQVRDGQHLARPQAQCREYTGDGPRVVVDERCGPPAPGVLGPDVHRGVAGSPAAQDVADAAGRV